MLQFVGWLAFYINIHYNDEGSFDDICRKISK